MQPISLCPQCGHLMAEGRCPACGFMPLTSPNAAAGERSEGRIVLIAIFISFSISALLVFLGFRLIQKSLQHRASDQKSYHHNGPVARLDELKGSGRIYLVQMGSHKDPYSLEDFAQWLRSKYNLNVTVLPPTATDSSAWNDARKQYVAELLYAQLKRDHPDLALNPGAYLIGFTDADMYSEHELWHSSFTQRDMRRTAIISSEGMQDSPLQIRIKGAALSPSDASQRANEHLQARLRRILLKDVAIEYWHLPLNQDPTSLLHDTLDPDLPPEEIYESDLDPARSSRGQFLPEPCIFFQYKSGHGIQRLPGPAIRSCGDFSTPDEDTGLEIFEVDLRLGLLMDNRTDFDLPDIIPIQFQRTTRDGWTGINPFGISGTDNYDEFLASADNVTISVVRADGGRSELVRQPRWLPILSLVKYVNEDQPGSSELRWRPKPYEHYDLTRFDGAVQSFLPCEGPKVFCYLTNYRDFAGRELKFVRGPQRRLERLVSPNQHWLALTYDSAGRIAQVTDSQGRVVHYDYDSANRLTSVTYPSGERCFYTYDNTQHLLTFSASPAAGTPPRVLMRNEYSDGLLVKQTFDDGSTYSYSYNPRTAAAIRSATVQAPDGKVFNLKVSDSFAIIHEK